MDYATILASVTTLIEDSGRTTRFEQLAAVSADTDRPWRGAAVPGAEVTIELPAVFVSPDSLTDFGINVVLSDMLKTTDMVCLVAPNEQFDLRKTHSINDEQGRWAVTFVYELRPGDTSLLYAIGVKK